MDPPIFVVGAPRSGTTLTGRILGSHPTIYAPGETHFFEDIWARRKELGPLKTRDEISNAVSRILTLYERYNFPETQARVNRFVDSAKLIEEVSSTGGGYSALYLCFFGSLFRESGKQRICDDTPKHLFYFDAIFELFPKAKAIICYRDPRDFLCSYKNYWQRSTDSKRIKALYHPILTSMVWRSSSNAAKSGQKKFSRDRIMTVKYEDIVNGPEEQVRKLCQFLQIEMNPEMLDVETHNSSFSGSSSGIFTTSVGRWVQCLDSNEAWWVQRINKNIMASVGYDLARIHPQMRSLIKDVILFPVSFLRALYANRSKRGPTLTYLRRRLQTLRK